MGWNNPPIPWGELERRLSGRHSSPPDDGPIKRRRAPYRPKDEVRPPATPVVPYAELHCHSNFSFLDGASGPDRLVEEAVRLRLPRLALTHHNGVAGAPLFAETAHKYTRTSLRPLYRAEPSPRLSAPP